MGSVREVVQSLFGTDADDWNFLQAKSPKQKDGISCGVFVCITSLAVCVDQDPMHKYDAGDVDELRNYIGAVLCSGGFTLQLSFSHMMANPQVTPVRATQSQDDLLVPARSLAKVAYAALSKDGYEAQAEAS